MPLNEACANTRTIDPTKHPDEVFTYVDVSSVSNRTFRIEQANEILGRDAPSRARKQIEEGDVIFATVRPTLMRLAQVPPELNGQVCSTGYVVLRPKEKLDGRFLYYSLLRTEFLQAMQELQSGASYPAVTDTQVFQQHIPLPQLDEQKRIVAVLDQAFAALDRARAHAEANLADAGELLENFLSFAFANSGPKWELASFDDPDLIRIIDGDRGKNYPKKEDFSVSGDCLFLNTKNVRPDGFDFSKVAFISRSKDAALSKGKLTKRDVILTTRGTVGNVGIFDVSVPFEEIRINSGMLILRPNEGKLRSEYLFGVLRSRAFKTQIEVHVSGAAQPQLPIRSLRKFTFPMPKDISEQLKIVSTLQRLEEKCMSLIAQYQSTLADLTDLRQSLLQKAFSGQLT